MKIYKKIIKKSKKKLKKYIKNLTHEKYLPCNSNICSPHATIHRGTYTHPSPRVGPLMEAHGEVIPLYLPIYIVVLIQCLAPGEFHPVQYVIWKAFSICYLFQYSFFLILKILQFVQFLTLSWPENANDFDLRLAFPK